LSQNLDPGRPLREAFRRGSSYRDEWTVSLLVSASRRTRRDAVRLLPDLLAALIAEAEAEIVQVEDAAQEIGRFTTAIRAIRSRGGK
jgi:hypothetical protein